MYGQPLQLGCTKSDKHGTRCACKEDNCNHECTAVASSCKPQDDSTSLPEKPAPTTKAPEGRKRFNDVTTKPSKAEQIQQCEEKCQAPDGGPPEENKTTKGQEKPPNDNVGGKSTKADENPEVNGTNESPKVNGTTGNPGDNGDNTATKSGGQQIVDPFQKKFTALIVGTLVSWEINLQTIIISFAIENYFEPH